MIKYVVVIFVMLTLSACQTTGGKQDTSQEKSAMQASAQEGKQVKLPVYWNLPAAQKENMAISDAFKARVMQYWQQFYQRDWSANYQLETPANRKLFTEAAYNIYFRGGWTSTKITIDSIRLVNENLAVVKTLIQMKHPVKDEKRRLGKTDKWEKVDGVWYHKFEDPLIQLRAL